ncbi:winged helix DNA-binding domain-containing protein [Streptacidiphilus jiangxiensis]|uniref:Winged helix DNA-binding domain-containing protein n=1 Tax=Streptacidiphilus jiangxiensis TaxID=235985 RepID=A0A1H7YJN7_STRJI|nr:winged helix DNA-binding domain-containing protein [Streptacidiphilus jiangxiensis]SEM46151.1 Winged helix DNA-binding domain-containing protein [Streptacidiphilus jiangxiensis]
MSLPSIDTAERRARINARLLTRRKAPLAVADDLVALHATDAATVYLSLAARLTAPTVAAVERALYDEVALVRLLAMRRTLFVVPVDLAPVVDTAAARAIAAKEREKLLDFLREGGGWDAAWLEAAERETLEALHRIGPASGQELGAAVPALQERVTVAAGKPYEAVQTVASRVLRVLAAENRIRRDRPRGSWTSSAYRWTESTPWPELPIAPARAELVRRWLASYGPGTEADLKWWTGWPLGAVRKALAEVGAERVALPDAPAADGDGFVLPGDTAPVRASAPRAALLPALDPTAMGWRERAWYTDPGHADQLFDRTGNIGPTVWWAGRVVGGWAQATDGSVVWRLLEDVGAEAASAVEAEAAHLTAFLGDARVTPRFRTPLERELSS